MTASPGSAVGLRRTLGFWDLVMLAMGTVIGSGIYLVPSVVLRQTGMHTGPAMLVWIVGGILSLLGALTYAELGAMKPEAGGLYAFIRDAFGSLPSFLYGWTSFFVIASGSIATLAVAFSNYVSQIVPVGPIGARLIAVAVIAVACAINVRGTRESATVQNWTTGLKVSALLAMGGALIAFGHPAPAEASVSGAGDVAPSSLASGFGAAMIGVLWAYEGWQYVTFSAGETRDPQRTFPRAITVATAALIATYMIASYGYVSALGPQTAARSNRVAADAMSSLLGPAAGKLVAILILVSIFSAANGIMMTASRLYYAMARDGVFFQRLAAVNERFGTPVVSILSLAGWSMVLAVSGTFEQLLTYVVFTGWIFYGLGGLAVMRLRRIEPNTVRPFRVPLYPLTPLLFAGSAALLVGHTVITQPLRAALGLVVVLIGTPAFYLWRARLRRAPLVQAAALLLLFLSACGGARAVPQSGPTSGTDEPYDVVIANGRVVDGAGNAWFYGDIGIRGDRIARVVRRGSLTLTGRRTIDARGKVVTPGFIDIQAGGNYVTGDGRDVSKVTQGITTEIFGEAYTAAPISELSLVGATPAAATASRRYMGPHGFDTWLRAMESHGISPNVGSFVGASTLRQFGMGMHMGAASGAAMDSMRTAMRRAMEDGAFGLGTALIYPPGNYASTEELIEIAKTMAPYGGLYITHMRSEADKVLEGMDEAIRIGREGGVPVEIYHLKAAGTGNWRKETAMIAKIDSARASGFDVQANMYPYTAGGTGLAACLPPLVSEDGQLFARVASDTARAKIRAEVEHPTSFWESLCEQATPQGVLIATLRSAANAKYSGLRLAEISKAMGKDWLDTVMDLLLTEKQNIGTMFFLMSEDNVRLQLTQPWMKFGTDAGGTDPDSTKALAHPRSYGTYPRILGKYVRDEHVMLLEDAIRKMTSAVAERLLIPDRGLIRPGMFADIVVFDPERIRENSTYEKPLQLSTGVDLVMINGVDVVRDGRHTGAKPGRIVRGPAWRPAAQ